MEGTWRSAENGDASTAGYAWKGGPIFRHLRNHGFLLGTEGWRLSPVYDINPQPWPGGLSLNVDESRNDCDLELARSVAEYFRLKPDQAGEIIERMRSVVRGWETAAQDLSISRDEVERMRLAFER